MKERRRFFVLTGILLVMIMIFTSIVLVSDYTKTRLIQRKQDEVRAFYTSLYFDATGEGSAIALDNGTGYLTFDIMNYIGEDVTERDIVYEIKEPSTYYTSTNKEILSDDLDHDSDFGSIVVGSTKPYEGANTSIHVRDVWNQPKPVGRDTYKYTYSVLPNENEKSKNPNEGTAEQDYLFEHEVLENSDGTANSVGKKHTVTVKFERDKLNYGSIDSTENVSIVIQLLKPYVEVYIINIVVSERLIVFSNQTVEEFEHEIEELYIQTVDIFSHINTNERRVVTSVVVTSVIDEIEVTKVITANPLQVTLSWDDLILNEVLIDNLPPDVKKGVNLDDYDSDSGEITLWIPQGASFKLQFYPTSTNYTVKAKVQIVDAVYGTGEEVIEGEYTVYNNLYGGYSDAEFIKNGDTSTDEILVLNKTKEGLVH